MGLGEWCLGNQGSLKRLQTTYTDFYYRHYWDLHTSVEEIIDGLHILVQQNLIFYLVRIPIYPTKTY
jgi:aryl-alcohol dehydrogenase-like predicted oxidoreductase